MAKQERKLTEFLARLLVGFAPFFKQVKRLTKFLKSKFYKHRVSFLTLFVILGLWLSYSLITWQACSDIDFWEAMEILITKRNWLIIAGLPAAFCLWLFRTKDRKDQIEKAEGQIQKAEEQIQKAAEQIQKTQESTQASLLSNNLTLLTSDRPKARAVGLVQLFQIRNKEKVYKDQIDIATPGIDLQNVYLERADLKGANLRSAKLQTTYLPKADLQKANLQSADLRNAYLHDTKLQDADLRGTNLQNAKLQGADLWGADVDGKTKFEGAKYNAQTKFPHDNFKPEEHGMKFDPESMK